MALEAYLKFGSKDSTKFINIRSQDLIRKGVFKPEDPTKVLELSETSLSLKIKPFATHTLDGMIVRDEALSIALDLVVPPENEPIVYVVVLNAKYNATSAPTLELKAILEADFNNHPNKDYLITFARISVPQSNISPVIDTVWVSYCEQDRIDPVGRDIFRGKFASKDFLPSNSPSKQNIAGDAAIVKDESTIYVWNGDTEEWIPAAGTVNDEGTLSNWMESRHELLRITQGSGIIVGARDKYSTLLPTTGTHNVGAGVVPIGEIFAILNGHFVRTRHIDFQLPTPRPNATRYDLLFLEVWRERVTGVIMNLDYESYDGIYDGLPSANTIKFVTLRDRMEMLSIRTDENTASSDYNPLEIPEPNYTLMTKYRLSTTLDVPYTKLVDPGSAAELARNISGNAFSRKLDIDPNLWYAIATGKYDGYSFAIPLLIIRRLSQEEQGTENIGEYGPDKKRQIFHVYPRVDASFTKAVAEILSRGYFDGPDAETNLSGCLRKAGEIRAHTSPEEHPNKVYIPVNSSYVINGLKLDFKSSVEVDLGPAPGNSFKRQLVVLVGVYAVHPNSQVSPHSVGGFLPPQLRWPRSSGVRISGRYPVYAQFEVRTYDVGTNSQALDEDDAMTEAGWTKTSPTKPGLWSRYANNQLPQTQDAMIYVPNDAREYAIPLCLVHRMNTQAWTLDNQNGGTGRPDGLAHDMMYKDRNILDLRRLILKKSESGSSIPDILDASVKKVMSGDLKTRFSPHPLAGNSVSGTRHTIVNTIGEVQNNAFLISMDPNRPIWSEAPEVLAYATTFLLDQEDAVSSDGVIRYHKGIGDNEALSTITITAPDGAYILTEDAETDFPSGQRPVFDVNATILYHSADRTSLSLINFDGSGSFGDQWTENNQDDELHFTEMRQGFANFIADGYDRIYLTFYFVWHRSESGRYLANRGFSSTPETIFKARYKPAGTLERDINVGLTVVQLTTFFSQDHVTFRRGNIATVIGREDSAGLKIIGPALTDVITPGIPKFGITGYDATQFSITSIVVSSNGGSITFYLASDEIDFNNGGLGQEALAEIVFQATYEDAPENNLDSWVEIGRVAHSVSGRFTYEEHTTTVQGNTDLKIPLSSITNIDGATPSAMLAFSIPPAIGSPPTYIYKRTDGGDWEWIDLLQVDSFKLPQPFNSFLAIDAPLTTLGIPDNTQIKILAPVQVPFKSGDILSFTFETSAYQGFATVDTARLYLRGTVQAVSSIIATTKGMGETLLIFRPAVDFKVGKVIPNALIHGSRNSMSALNATGRWLGALTRRFPYPEVKSLISGGDVNLAVFEYQIGNDRLLYGAERTADLVFVSGGKDGFSSPVLTPGTLIKLDVPYSSRLEATISKPATTYPFQTNPRGVMLVTYTTSGKYTPTPSSVYLPPADKGQFSEIMFFNGVRFEGAFPQGPLSFIDSTALPQQGDFMSMFVIFPYLISPAVQGNSPTEFSGKLILCTATGVSRSSSLSEEVTFVFDAFWPDGRPLVEV